jgi:uncharacterized membrane protein YiaA
MVRGNSDVVTVITTVITVFAGFLVAIIAVLGDPAMTTGASWRAAQNKHSEIESAVIKHTMLFYIYLLTIGLLFAGVLVQKSYISEKCKNLVEFSYLYFGAFSFF